MKIGQKIKFVNQSGTGEIVSIEGNEAIVLTDIGFEETFLLKEILPLDNSLENIQVERIEKKETQPIAKKSILLVEQVIDLHFSQLVEYPNAYTPHEKLNYQLNFAKREIEKHRGKAQKLILIHGKGSGRLESELLKILTKTPRIDYYDADFKRYKLGAVEIKYL